MTQVREVDGKFLWVGGDELTGREVLLYSEIRRLRSEVDSLTDRNGILQGYQDGMKNFMKFDRIVEGHEVFDDLGQANAKIEALEALLREKEDTIQKLVKDLVFERGGGLGRDDQETLINLLRNKALPR